MRLPLRLQNIADLVPQDASVWDVGTDHAKLPIGLLQSGKIHSAIASDLRTGPLESAHRNITRCGLEGSVELICCDGVQANRLGDLDTIIVAGMGGETIASILSAVDWSGRTLHLILQPMSSVEDLRSFLYSGNYRVINEHLVVEKKTVYLLIEAETGGTSEEFDLADTRVGKHLPDSPAFCRVLQRELKRLRKELSGCSPEQVEEYAQAIQKCSKRLEENAWRP